MQNKDQNTDFETRSLDTSCVNESKLSKNANIKYLIVGALFGILLLKRKSSVGTAFRKCSFPVFSYVWNNRKWVVVGYLHFHYKKNQY
jgi:hypothetical protein